MSYVVETMTNLAAQTGFAFLKPGNFIMILVALVFLYLAIAKGYEPLLLVPISFGMLLVNLYPSIMEEGGLLHYFYLLDEWSILPSLIFEGTEKYTIFILTLIKKEKKHQNFYDSGGFFVRRNINCLFFRRKFLFFIH